MNTLGLTLILAIVALISVAVALKATLDDRKNSSLNLVRPDIRNITPVSREDVETIRNWSLAGMPTSAPITLGLIEKLDEYQRHLDIERSVRTGSVWGVQ